MKNEIAEFLEAIGETEYAREVESMHNRLEAFSDGLDKAAIDCAIKAAEEAIAQRDELLSALEAFNDSHEECEGFDGFTAQIVSMDDYHKAQEAFEKFARTKQSAESEMQASLTRTDETQTSIPAIVFYPAGSLGEAVEEWGSHGA